MDIQDKEFDALFRSKLDDFEVTPSAQVWDGINNGINTGRRKRLLVPLLSIAANIIVLISAGLFFIPKDIRIKSNHPIKNVVAIIKSATDNNAQAKGKLQPDAIKTTREAKQQFTQVDVNHTSLRHIIKRDLIKNKREPEIKVEEHPALAATNTAEQIKAIVPDKATAIAIEPVEEPATFITKPAITVTPVPADIKLAPPSVKARRRARTLGDLINLAVAKVDKRKDKFIEFTNTDDDDEANITGINLGILKIKKEK